MDAIRSRRPKSFTYLSLVWAVPLWLVGGALAAIGWLVRGVWAVLRAVLYALAWVGVLVSVGLGLACGNPVPLVMFAAFLALRSR